MSDDRPEQEISLTRAERRTEERIARQKARLARIDARIGELMSQRVDEEARLADLYLCRAKGARCG